jgi:hypothetical protein
MLQQHTWQWHQSQLAVLQALGIRKLPLLPSGSCSSHSGTAGVCVVATLSDPGLTLPLSKTPDASQSHALQHAFSRKQSAHVCTALTGRGGAAESRLVVCCVLPVLCMVPKAGCSCGGSQQVQLGFFVDWLHETPPLYEALRL